MELKVIHSKPNTRIHDRLGITDDRVFQLTDHCASIFASMDYNSNQAVNLECEYKRLAEFCNSIEEYTVCMHVFIFMLARKGRLVSETLRDNN